MILVDLRLGVVLIATYFYLFGFAENFSEITEVFCLFSMLFLNFIEGAWIGNTSFKSCE